MSCMGLPGLDAKLPERGAEGGCGDSPDASETKLV
eukprot:CAMPEP_0202875254 /NCGR_PEP_ID=MMETSP1391-20130828/26952_1 /ASSEMBLY_ACC=CAM_ASM_000867 /TAXON_ID=1034604 /ORGANISM="Chlamydomonas leiostraca, Strain SAG 11-49" /LENGTH=34 /DNA_ID= /DNA_START= /DNA_END= /DNA_ORIENTATION=